MGKYKLFEKLNVCLCDLYSNLGSYLTTTLANGSLLTLLIIIIEAAAERCSESKNALVCWEMIAIYSKLRGEIQLLRHHLMTEHILCL